MEGTRDLPFLTPLPSAGLKRKMGVGAATAPTPDGGACRRDATPKRASHFCLSRLTRFHLDGSAVGPQKITGGPIETTCRR